MLYCSVTFYEPVIKEAFPLKYWRGYLVAAIVTVFRIALERFAQTHAQLVDMFYPYVTRMMQSYLAQWSLGADFCLWQVLLMALGVLVLASAVLMLIFKWNPVQWLGWVLAAGSLVVLLNTGLYGLNRYAGPLADDIRLPIADYTASELETAAKYYQEQANTLAQKVERTGDGTVKIGDLAHLNAAAGKGFEVLTRQKFASVFAGPTLPVKELKWANHFTRKGQGCQMIGVTGEAAVNPQTPSASMPFEVVQAMTRRMSIAIDADAKFGAFLSCHYNSDVNFQYAGHLMAYYYCLEAIEHLARNQNNNALLKFHDGANGQVKADIEILRDFYGSDPDSGKITDLLVNWHIQQFVLPTQAEDVTKFDPLDESQVDLSGLVYAPITTEPAETQPEG